MSSGDESDDADLTDGGSTSSGWTDIEGKFDAGHRMLLMIIRSRSQPRQGVTNVLCASYKTLCVCSPQRLRLLGNAFFQSDQGRFLGILDDTLPANGESRIAAVTPLQGMLVQA